MRNEELHDPDPKSDEQEPDECVHHWIQVPGTHVAWHDNEFWKMRCEHCGKVIECEN